MKEHKVYIFDVDAEDRQRFAMPLDEDELSLIETFITMVNETPCAGAAPGVSITIINKDCPLPVAEEL